MGFNTFCIESIIVLTCLSRSAGDNLESECWIEIYIDISRHGGPAQISARPAGQCAQWPQCLQASKLNSLFSLLHMRFHPDTAASATRSFTATSSPGTLPRCVCLCGISFSTFTREFTNFFVTRKSLSFKVFQQMDPWIL